MKEAIIFSGDFVIRCLKKRPSKLLEAFEELAKEELTIILLASSIAALHKEIVSIGLHYSSIHFIKYRPEEENSLTVGDLRKALNAAGLTRGTLVSDLNIDVSSAHDSRLNFIWFKDSDKKIDLETCPTPPARSYLVLEDLSLLLVYHLLC